MPLPMISIPIGVMDLIPASPPTSTNFLWWGKEKMKIDHDNKDFWISSENEHEAKFLKHLLDTNQLLRPVAGFFNKDKGGLTSIQYHISS